MKKNLYLLFISTVLLLGFQSSIEERLYTLNRDLMCPVCDGLTLEQSQAIWGALGRSRPLWGDLRRSGTIGMI